MQSIKYPEKKKVAKMRTEAAANSFCNTMLPPQLVEFPSLSSTSQAQSKGCAIPRGRALFWEGDHQHQKIEVLEGVVRAVRLFDNGNRQILAFYWPGDTIVGFRSECQPFTAEAVTNCRVRFSGSSYLCQDGNSCGARRILKEILLLMTNIRQKNVLERIVIFLLDIRPHLLLDPKLPLARRLQISRADIADYIGTSVETVCRTMADLKARKLIDMPNRKTIRYLDVRGLQLIADHSSE